MSPRLRGSKGLKSEHTRQLIYDTAMSLFKEKGYSDTTMRDIAKNAGVAVSAAYYYYDSKESIVVTFYQALLDEEKNWLDRPAFRRAEKWRDALGVLIRFKLDQLREHRRIVEGVFRSASDPSSMLSPFSPHTRKIREGNVGLFKNALDRIHEPMHPDLYAHLPRISWLFQMGIILFWFYDRSPKQANTERLLDRSLDLIQNALRFFNLPLTGALRRTVIEMVGFMDQALNGGGTNAV